MEWDQTVQMIEATVQVENTRPGGDRRISTGLLVQAPWPDGTPRTVLVTAAMALPAGDNAEAALGRVPQAPDLGDLERLFAREGVDVSAILVPERF